MQRTLPVNFVPTPSTIVQAIQMVLFGLAKEAEERGIAVLNEMYSVINN